MGFMPVGTHHGASGGRQMCGGGKSSPHSISQCDKHQEKQSVLKTVGKILVCFLVFSLPLRPQRAGNPKISGKPDVKKKKFQYR